MRVVAYASLFISLNIIPNFGGREWNPCLDSSDKIMKNIFTNMLGENSQSYLAALSKLLNTDPQLDGIYFDEIYPFNLPESYAVMRQTRKLLGSGRRIMYHTTQGTAASPWYGGYVLIPNRFQDDCQPTDEL